MAADDTDHLVQFQNVTVLGATGPALLCGIEGQRVWLLRSQISGKLWRIGDRGTLLVRHSVARDSNLIGRRGPHAVPPL